MSEHNLGARYVVEKENARFFIDCPYCGSSHAGEFDKKRMKNPRTGVINVLSSLPCGNKILLFFSASHQLRGHQVIDEINIVEYHVEKVPSDPGSKKIASRNYNDEYNKFATERGLQRRLKDVIQTR